MLSGNQNFIFKLKYFSKEKNLKKSLLILFLVFVIVIVLVLIILSFFINNINLYAYNRDSNSGTREAFEESIDFNSEEDKYSENVFEVSGNDIMFSKVAQTSNSIGYVSLDTAYKEDGEPSRDGIKILGTEAIHNPEDIEDNIADYDAKRPFNVFFRVSKDLSSRLHLSDNLYINSKYASSKNQQANIWDKDFIIPPEWNLSEDTYTVTNDYQAKFALSFLFFNWLLYSNDSNSILSLFYKPLNEEVFSFFDTNTNSLDDPFQVYLDHTGLDEYLDFTSENNRFEISTQGSTSVVSSLNDLMYDEENGFIKICEDYGFYINYEQLHLGSGDAFKNNLATSSEIFLGFQSRGFKDEEPTGSDWGYTEEDIKGFDDYIDSDNFLFDVDEEANNGFYNLRAYYEKDSDFLYSSYYTDAIVFIINENFKSEIDLNLNDINWIKMEGVNQIYTNNVDFDWLWKNGYVG